jgi:hypothetical protein
VNFISQLFIDALMNKIVCVCVCVCVAWVQVCAHACVLVPWDRFLLHSPSWLWTFYARLVLNLQFSCFNLWRAEITSIHQYTWLIIYF